jgi:hypothetical protein
MAVSVPSETFRALEGARKKLGLPRSQAVARALERWISEQTPGSADARYVEAYLRQPENVGAVAAVAEHAAAVWDEWSEDE